MGLTHKAPDHNNPNEEIRIQAIGCWDTVGALGIPINPLLQKWLDLPAFLRIRHLNWMDTTLTDNVMNAFHALALDEHRAPFSPAVWEKPKGCDTNLKQVWFPGAHSGVGGGYDDTATADISLAWMMDQLSGNSCGQPSPNDIDSWIEFEDDYIGHIHRVNEQWYENNPPSRNWGNGTVFRSLRFPQSLAGMIDRTPGRHRQLDKVTWKAKGGVLMRDTNEFIHASVRARMDLGGHGPINNPESWSIWSSLFNLVHKVLGRTGERFYQPSALKGWELKDGHSAHDDYSINNVEIWKRTGKTPVWEWKGKDAPVKKNTCLLEDRLGRYELQLLAMYHEVDNLIEASNRGVTSIESLRELHKQMQDREDRRSRTI